MGGGGSFSLPQSLFYRKIKSSSEGNSSNRPFVGTYLRPAKHTQLIMLALLFKIACYADIITGKSMSAMV